MELYIDEMVAGRGSVNDFKKEKKKKKAIRTAVGLSDVSG